MNIREHATYTCLFAAGCYTIIGMTPLASILAAVSMQSTKVMTTQLTQEFHGPIKFLGQLTTRGVGVMLALTALKIAKIPIYSSVDAPSLASAVAPLAVISPCVAAGSFGVAAIIKYVGMATHEEHRTASVVNKAIAVGMLSTLISVASATAYLTGILKA